jgi:lipopolysaccharide export LptBFGC system permease protein LptF
VPVSLLAAGCFCYGRWVNDREYVAASAAGVSPLHLLLPQALIAGLCAVLAYAGHGTLLPYANYLQRDFSRYVYQQLEHLGDQKDVSIAIDDDSRIHFEEVESGTRLKKLYIETLRNWNQLTEEVAIKQGASGGSAATPEGNALVPVIISAENAQILVRREKNDILLALNDVNIRLADRKTGEARANHMLYRYWDGAHLGKLQLTFEPSQRKRRDREQSNQQLLVELAKSEERLASADLSANERRAYRTQVLSLKLEYWQRKATVASVVSFALIGFAVALALRLRHRLMPLFVSFGVAAIFYYPLLIAGKSMAALGVPPAVAAMGGNFALCAIALPLIGRLLVR